MIYAICEEFYPEVEKKLNSVAKKCVKNGNDFIFNVVGEEIREIYNKETKLKEHYKFIIVEVEGTAKIDNWECIAVLENNNTGNIIRRINTEIEIPIRFRNSDNICEHCNTKRQRNNLFVIHNVVTDEWKQVGGNCLKLYTNGLNMEYVAAYMDGIICLEEGNGFIGSCNYRYHDVKEIISYATEVIEKIGYFNSQSDLPTKALVSWFLYHDFYKAIEHMNKELKDYRLNIQFNKIDFHKENTKSTVKKIIEYYLNLKDDCEFIHNVQVMLKEGYVTSHSIGYLCYLPEGYARYIKKEAEKTKRNEESKNSVYFGEIGKRYKNENIHSIDVITSWITDFGVTYLYKIVLTNGAILIWKTSNNLYLEDGKEFDKISFTVKEHKEYKSEKQTEVARCKINVKVK